MTEAEWLATDDPVAMLEALQEHWRGGAADLEKLIRRYLLACCRRIWILLPLEGSRWGVEVAECLIEGRANQLTRFRLHSYDAEGAAFYMESPSPMVEEFLRERREAEPEEIRKGRLRYEAGRTAHVAELIEEIESLPAAEWRGLVRPRPGRGQVSTHELLSHAAYFAHHAIVPFGSRGWNFEKYAEFLSAPLLRDFVGSPYRRPRPPAWRPRPARFRG